MNVKIISTLLISAALVGCSSLTINKESIKQTPLELEPIHPLNPKPIQWYVITPENYSEVFSKMESEGYDLVLYGLTDDGYQNLSINMAEIRKYIILQQKSIDSYKYYYESSK